jgi:hypothetical protein
MEFFLPVISTYEKYHKSALIRIWRTAALGLGCVKTQKRPRVVPSKLDWISDEVGLCWKEVIGSEASQMPDSLRLILTSTIAFF